MLKLKEVTLVVVTGVKIRESVKALKYSMEHIEFGDAMILTYKKPFRLPHNIKYVQIDKMKSIDDFNYFMVYELYKYIQTNYILLIHYDGFVVNPDKWMDKFLEYDYIGAPWPIPEEGNNSYRDVFGNLCRVGNSVSIRSKQLLELPTKLKIPWVPQQGIDGELYHEDGFICCSIKHILENNGLSIAPLDVAKYFSHETMIPEIEGIKPFAFHKWAGTNKYYPRFRKFL